MSGGWLDPDIIRAFKFFGTVSLNMVISIFLGFLAGRWIDHRLGTEPWFASAGFVLGAAAGFWGVYKLGIEEYTRDGRGGRKQ